MAGRRNEKSDVWRHIDASGDLDACWPWLLSCNPQTGYGQFTVNYRLYSVPRLIFELTHGRVPPGKRVCHSCDNRRCANPRHLFAGTAKDNSEDMVRKGRQSRRVGVLNTQAKLDDENVRLIRSLLAAGMRQREIASLFGLHQVAVSLIKRGLRWAHV